MEEYEIQLLDTVSEDSESEIYLEKAINIVEGLVFTKDWINMPGNYLTPEVFAKDVEEKLTSAGCEVEVLEEKDLEALGMNLFLAVGNSGANKTRLAVIRYQGDESSDKKFGLVGKGITVDTGGYSLKAAASLMYSKGDMGGAAAVAGAMYGLAKNKVKANVVAVLPICENRLSNTSHIPGDVVVSMSGKTVEIMNTDAEGRLILADSLTYIIEKEKVNTVLDVATLTGAVVGSLGTVAAGCMSNDDEYLEVLMKSAKLAGEKYWRFPGYEEYKELIKSKVADLKNIGGAQAGTITAGLFLQEFVGDTPWIHLDIAGTSQTESPSFHYHTFGGTGFATASMYFLIENLK